MSLLCPRNVSEQVNIFIGNRGENAKLLRDEGKCNSLPTFPSHSENLLGKLFRRNCEKNENKSKTNKHTEQNKTKNKQNTNKTDINKTKH